MAETKDLVVLDMTTPVARWPRRIPRLPRLAADEAARRHWDETARLRDIGLALSPHNRPGGLANARD